MNIRTHIGQQIADLRTTLGITQMQLAELSGVTQANLSRIESGRYNVRIETLAAILGALDYKIEMTPK